MMSGWRFSASWWSYQRALNHMWTRSDGSWGVEGRVPGATYSAERNAIVDNCKQGGAAWTGVGWGSGGGALKQRHISLTPAPPTTAHTL